MNNRFYSNKRIVTAIVGSIAIFILVLLIADANNYSSDLEGKHFAFAIFAAFLVHVILIPKILWQFILDRVRELGKAIRGEE